MHMMTERDRRLDVGTPALVEVACRGAFADDVRCAETGTCHVSWETRPRPNALSRYPATVRCTPASYAGRARRLACERRAAAAGWQVPAEPTMRRLNSQVLGF